ncbi:Sugar phosphate exchanger 3 [Varanus komodoensis]|nr:Sugar phosphate exchanger 3 [Varanus komodoensis]
MAEKRNDIAYIPALKGEEGWGGSWGNWKDSDAWNFEEAAREQGTGITGHTSSRGRVPAHFLQLWNSSHLFPDAEGATLFLGTLDTIFLFSYAVGLFVSGIIADRLNMRWVLSFGMCSSALVVFVFGTLTEWLHFYNVWFYSFLWIVNGLLQSTGWPCVVAVMGNWFGKAGLVVLSVRLWELGRMLLLIHLQAFKTIVFPRQLTTENSESEYQ